MMKTQNKTIFILSRLEGLDNQEIADHLELSKKTVELSPEAKNLDTLAAAYAEVGKFEDAIITQEKAIDLVKKEDDPNNTVDQYIERLKFYNTHKPWREK